MKSVLISIKPQWCELIASGKKTIEVRKSRPKLRTPFKVYIYCTKDFKPNVKYGFKLWAGRGKVIGEFVCDSIDTVDVIDTALMRYLRINGKADMFFSQKSCLDVDVLYKYLLRSTGYGWHISNLAIYDKPKALSEFRKPCDYDLGCKSCSMYFGGSAFAEPYCKNGDLEITRPPQSWCYVEELP